MVQILRPVDPFKLSASRGYLYLQGFYKVSKIVDLWAMEKGNGERLLCNLPC